MMKNLLLLFFIFCAFNAPAIQTDTSAYQTQRLKVNALLTERSAKFGQYDQSLDARTGIFGFQTKDDIKKSSEILRQIVLTDNNIFKELKILMDYKDQEVKQAQRNVNDVNSRSQNYMTTIKKLQDQNELLNTELSTKQKSKSFSYYLNIFLILTLSATIYFFLKKIKKNNN